MGEGWRHELVVPVANICSYPPTPPTVLACLLLFLFLLLPHRTDKYCVAIVELFLLLGVVFFFFPILWN